MKPIIICFACRRRVTPEEIATGLHNHADSQQQTRKEQHGIVDYGATQV
ncbi:MAG TPA: hypothetical protein VGX03_19330 [Candidatus Binatia bacterium]|jgi:hypothetical protein|nr:hypothetical protein [Candidatus Binatia bacterium]